jgi:hypothetical protein
MVIKNKIISFARSSDFGMAEMFYRRHYMEVISKGLTEDDKRNLAKKISDLTLREPVWLDHEKDFSKDFPELKPYVNVKVSGTYLCAILSGLVEDLGGEGV